MTGMAIDLQASIENLSKINWEEIKGAVQDYAPVLTVIKNTWTRESLLEISEGKVFVPDETLNELLAKNISEESQITAMKVTSKDTGRMDIYAETKNMGRIEVSGIIEECIHKGEDTHVSYRVKERELLDHGLGSWIFSRISLSMTQKIMGGLHFSDDVPTKIRHNTITVDLSKLVEASDLAKTEFRGYRLVDMVEIEGAKSKEGGIEIDTKLNVPDEVKAALLAILKR